MMRVYAHSYSACRIAECTGAHHCVHERDGKAPSIRACVVVAKIGSKDLASRIVHSTKHEREFKEIKHGHQRQGALSLTMGTDFLNIELHMLCLQWPSRPIRSYKMNVKLRHNVDIASGTMSNWFTKNKAYKGTFLRQNACSVS